MAAGPLLLQMKARDFERFVGAHTASGLEYLHQRLAGRPVEQAIQARKLCRTH